MVSFKLKSTYIPKRNFYTDWIFNTAKPVCTSYWDIAQPIEIELAALVWECHSCRYKMKDLKKEPVTCPSCGHPNKCSLPEHNRPK